MACDKPYGLRRVFIAKETAGVAGTFYELLVNNVELPKIFAEQVVIDESSGLRGDSAYVQGNINELTGTITISLPAAKANFLNFAPVQTLFYGAGFNTTTDSITPQNSGSCGNTFCLYTLDRTGHLAERLENCIVTNIDFTLNRSDVPSVAFAFQGAKKYEFWGANSSTAFSSDSETVTTTAAGSFNCGLGSVSGLAAGVMPVKIDSEAAYISAFSADNGITFTRPLAAEHAAAVSVLPSIPPGAVEISDRIAYATNRSWNVLADGNAPDLKIQSASLSIETGMSYGELIVGHSYLSEVLVGTLNATGSFTVYVDSAAGAAAAGKINDSGASYAIVIGGYKIVLPKLVFSEPPDLSLAKNEPASGDFAFKAFNDSGFDLVSLAAA